jgi:hypothetical protein
VVSVFAIRTSVGRADAIAALSPNGKILATTQFDGPAQLWHLNLRTRT